MNKIFRIILFIVFLLQSNLVFAKQMPYNDWQRYQASSAVILGEVLPGEGKKKIKVLEYYKGSGLVEPLDVNLVIDLKAGASPAELYSGYKLVAYLGKKSDAGVYDLALGSDFIYVADKNEYAAELAAFISRVDQAKSDLAKFKIIEDALTGESKIVKSLPVLFLKGTRGILDPQKLSTWLPVETNAMPKSLSRAASNYLTKYMDEIIKNDPDLFYWLILSMVQNFDDEKEKILFDILRNKPLAVSQVVLTALTKTILKDRKKQKEELLGIAMLRIDEALNTIVEGDKPSVNKDDLAAQQYLNAVSNLSIDLGSSDEKIVNMVKLWAKKSPWNEFALSALASFEGVNSIDYINSNAAKTRDPGLIAILAVIGNRTTFNNFLQRISQGSVYGGNYENWDFKEIGPALLSLSSSLGATTKQEVLRAYLIYLARWQAAYPSGWNLSEAKNDVCRTEDILASVNKTLNELTGEKYVKPEQWLSFGAQKFNQPDINVFIKQLLKDAGPVLKAKEGPYATIDCAGARSR